MVMDISPKPSSFPVALLGVSRAQPVIRRHAAGTSDLGRDHWPTGLGWAVGAVTLCALTTPIAKLAYADGGDPLTLLVLRSALIIIAVGAAARFMPFSLALPPGTRLRSFLLGLFVAGGSAGILSSVMFIPVGLAVLIFYVFPLLVLLATSALSGTRMSVGEGVCAALTFAGLIVALAPAGETVDGRGVLLAAGAALSVAGVFLLSRSLMKDLRSSAILFWSNFFCGIAVLVAVMLLGCGDVLPLANATYLGWFEMTSISVMFLLAMIAQLAAIRSVGPGHTAAMFNLEPVLAMGFATLLLEERITAMQLLGSVMVIGALGVFSLVAQKANQ